MGDSDALALNKRFALILLGSLVVLGTGTHFLHAFQVRRTSGAMLDRARQLETEGRLNLAADYLGRYLSLNPNSADARLLTELCWLTSD